jgi:sialate O-acetylesterase
MVLEKTAKVPIWGKADPGEEVTVTLDGQTAKAKAGADGRLTATLNLKDSKPGPFEMTVEGKNKLTLSDLAVGEVWIASGQSNMEWVLMNTTDAEICFTFPR